MRNYIITTIERAISENKRVRIIYHAEDKMSERTIKPYSINDDTVVAYCYLRRAKRYFKTDGILSAQLLEEKEKSVKKP